MIICKGLDVHDTITTIDEWKKKCPPERGDYHWQDGRSAKELAKEWVNGKGQALKNLLKNHPDFQGINLKKALQNTKHALINLAGAESMTCSLSVRKKMKR